MTPNFEMRSSYRLKSKKEGGPPTGLSRKTKEFVSIPMQGIRTARL